MADMENAPRPVEEVASEQPPPPPQPEHTEISSSDHKEGGEEAVEPSPPPRLEDSVDNADDASGSFDKNGDMSLPEKNLMSESKHENKDGMNQQMLERLKNELSKANIGALGVVELEHESEMEAKYGSSTRKKIKEEEIELEFEWAVYKLHTHLPYCPACQHQITKVILRKRTIVNTTSHWLLIALRNYFSIFILFVFSGFQMITSSFSFTTIRENVEPGNHWIIFDFFRSFAYRLSMFSFSWTTYRWNFSGLFSFGNSSPKIENNAEDLTNDESKPDGDRTTPNVGEDSGKNSDGKEKPNDSKVKRLTGHVPPIWGHVLGRLHRTGPVLSKDSGKNSDDKKKPHDSKVKPGPRDNGEKDSDNKEGEKGNNGGDGIINKDDGSQVHIGPGAADDTYREKDGHFPQILGHGKLRRRHRSRAGPVLSKDSGKSSDDKKMRDDLKVKPGQRDNGEKDFDNMEGEKGNNGGDGIINKEDGSQVHIGPGAADDKDGEKGTTTAEGQNKDDESEIEIETETDESESSDDERRPVINQTKLVEILKCIVYGGLIESITSLSVVFSTAASDTTTLNVLAIGLAVLLSGLIAFTYNMVDLKNDTYSEKKYQQLLGSEHSFLFHATIAIFSYLAFGLVSPITYSFAFRESDDKKYKMISVAAAAFACIFILAIAKAFVSRASYIKTTRFYLVMAVGLTGVGYGVGSMIEVLMLKLDWFKSAQRICVAPETVAGATWATY